MEFVGELRPQTSIYFKLTDHLEGHQDFLWWIPKSGTIVQIPIKHPWDQSHGAIMDIIHPQGGKMARFSKQPVLRPGSYSYDKIICGIRNNNWSRDPNG
jgi:hypothetical protein